jgi:hypothetical protein
LEKVILAECAALHALSNNENLTALAFQMVELAIIEYDIFMIFHNLPHLELEKEMTMAKFVFPGLLCLITKWMEHVIVILSLKLWT